MKTNMYYIANTTTANGANDVMVGGAYTSVNGSYDTVAGCLN